MKHFIFSVLATFPLWIQAQYYSAFQNEYFFGRMPVVKAEAMGQTEVALGGTVPSLFYNPAGIGIIENQEITLVSSGPYYLLTEADNYFVGYARRFHPKLVAAASFHQFATGPSAFEIEINGVFYPIDKPKTTNFALTVAATPIKNLHAGINFNYFRWKYINDLSRATTFHFDAGVLYEIPVSDTRKLSLGASVTNLFFDRISFESPAGDFGENALPVIARLGAAYRMKTILSPPGAEPGDVDILIAVEYQNLLNSEFHTAFRIGSEWVFYKVFAFRLGAYTHTEDDFGVSTNYSRIRDITYGFGIILPLSTWCEGKIPFDAHLDYTSLKQPPATSSFGRLPNMRGFSLRMVFPVSSR
ncbi:MAG: hypothetical protein SF052_19365 [Bacteroidia bacterium]|nr:hypothetical protein [Bacteroidia bacterium]